HGSETFSQLTGREVVLKAENLQRTGSFKIRGAVTRIAALSEQQRAAGVVAASAGNHGQAVAWAAREAGIAARIYVPQDAPMAKVEACRHYSAETELVGTSFEEALAAAHDDAEQTGATFIHPYEDEVVIAGQGMIDVTDDEISKAIVFLLGRTKLVVEGAGAVGVAALLAGRVEGSGPVVAVLSGGNIDPTMLISVMRHGLTVGGRYLVVRTHLSDRPGELIKLLSLVAEERGNLISVEHHREGMDISVSETEVELHLVPQSEDH